VSHRVRAQVVIRSISWKEYEVPPHYKVRQVLEPDAKLEGISGRNKRVKKEDDGTEPAAKKPVKPRAKKAKTEGADDKPAEGAAPAGGEEGKKKRKTEEDGDSKPAKAAPAKKAEEKAKVEDKKKSGAAAAAASPVGE
jgi:hypothetical protein